MNRAHRLPAESTPRRAKSTPQKPPSRKRRFLVPINIEIEVDERLLTNVLTEEWRQNFYRLTNPSDVAGHLAYNLIQDRRLSSLDGFADQPESAARIIDVHFDDDNTQELPRHELAGGALQSREAPHGPEYNWRCTCGVRGAAWQPTRKRASRNYQQHLAVEEQRDASSI